MPQSGKCWRHIVIGTYNSWLPGDPKGFRAKDHKVHSSGDYKNPPPDGEHAGLFHYSKGISGDPILIPKEVREVVGRKIIAELQQGNHRLLALAVSGMHSHWLVELPDDLSQIRQIVGQCKSKASHAIRKELPGRVWAREGSFKPVKDRPYHVKVYRYILRQEGAWVWSYKDEE